MTTPKCTKVQNATGMCGLTMTSGGGKTCINYCNRSLSTV